jgi:hypothetical protein
VGFPQPLILMLILQILSSYSSLVVYVHVLRDCMGTYNNEQQRGLANNTIPKIEIFSKVSSGVDLMDFLVFDYLLVMMG